MIFLFLVTDNVSYRWLDLVYHKGLAAEIFYVVSGSPSPSPFGGVTVLINSRSRSTGFSAGWIRFPAGTILCLKTSPLPHILVL